MRTLCLLGWLPLISSLRTNARAAGRGGAARTTGLYDRRDDTVALDEIERAVY
jgi:hypothetical protein